MTGIQFHPRLDMRKHFRDENVGTHAMLEGVHARACSQCGTSAGVRDWFAAERIEGVSGYARVVRIYTCLDCFSHLPERERRAYKLRETS